MSVWGMMFNFHTAVGSISPFRFSFATHGKGHGKCDSWKFGLFYPILVLNHWFLTQSLAPPPSSPVTIKSSSLKTVTSPLRAIKTGVTYLASRSFEDTSTSTTPNLLFSFYLNTDLCFWSSCLWWSCTWGSCTVQLQWFRLQMPLYLAFISQRAR